MTGLRSAYESLRGFGLSLPEAVEEMPWGHSALKVRKKSFVFLNIEDEELSLSVKLPASRDFALIFDSPSRPATASDGAAGSPRGSAKATRSTPNCCGAGS